MRAGGLALLLVLPHGRALAQVAGGTRFVEAIEFDDHGNSADISVQFGCPMRYLTHLPAAEGTELRIELQPLPGCGGLAASAFSNELPAVLGGGQVVAATRVETIVPGQITLTFTWRRREQFVLVQGADRTGMRIRLLNRDHGRSRVWVGNVGDQGGPVSRFAINLDSQLKPYDPAVLQAIGARLKAPVFVSEVEVEGQKWYRLRLGPFTQRAAAEGILNSVLGDYPRAWLAVGDDGVTTDPAAAAAQPAVQRLGSDPPLDTTTRQRLAREAESALRDRDFAHAIALLTTLQRQPEYPQREHAQELLGLARERAGQLAHAEAEDEEYLARYPAGPGAERVAVRLRALREASRAPRAGTGGGMSAAAWTLDGSISQTYRYDGTRVDNTIPAGTFAAGVPATASTSSNVLFNDVDALARHHGEDLDFLARLSAGYSRDFSNSGIGSGTMSRVSIASAELVDRDLGLLARVGRQIRNEDGILGTFDGLFLSYQFHPGWTLNVAGGFPVLALNATSQTNHRFESAALAYAPNGARWDVSVFAEAQQLDGLRDRNAVGFEARYLAPQASVVLLTDYDVYFNSLNAGALIGTVQLPMHWSVSVDAERRNAPILSLDNALIGQPVTTIPQLAQTFSQQQLYQLAQDRTAVTDEYSVTATRPLGDRFQLSFTAATSAIGAMPASGGVVAQPATGLNTLFQAQLYGQSLFWPGDFQVLNAEYSRTEVGTLDSIGLTTRFPLVGNWRIGPRVSVDRQVLAADGSVELSVLPSVLFDYQHGHSLVQFEFGGELGSRQTSLLLAPATQQTQQTTRYYVSLAYLVSF